MIPSVRGQSVALASHQGVAPGGRPWVEILRQRGARDVLVLAPEHGARGELPAGAAVSAEVGAIPFYFQGHFRPTPRLVGIDAVLFDLPLVGVRCFTFLDVLRRLVLRSAHGGPPLWVVERPNPLGDRVEGELVEPGLYSEVACFDLPYRYGLSTYEVAAKMARDSRAPVPRRILLQDSDSGFSPPSPNLRTPETLRVYPWTVFFEGTVLSEGRGTELPFWQWGHPELDAEGFARELQGRAGLACRAVEFVPRASKFAQQAVQGVRLEEAPRPDRDLLPLARLVLTLARMFLRGSGEDFWVRTPSGQAFVDKLWGGPGLRLGIEAGAL